MSFAIMRSKREHITARRMSRNRAKANHARIREKSDGYPPALTANETAHTAQLTILRSRPTSAPKLFKIDCLQIAYRRIIASRIANHK